MLKIPEALQEKYSALLVKNDIQVQFHQDFKKWLRYYLDFCKKYHHSYSSRKNLVRFINKLEEKTECRPAGSGKEGCSDILFRTVESNCWIRFTCPEGRCRLWGVGSATFLGIGTEIIERWNQASALLAENSEIIPVMGEKTQGFHQRQTGGTTDAFRC